MSQILRDETKKVLMYTEDKTICEKCKYIKKEEDQGGGQYQLCIYSNVCSFEVKPYAHCKAFEKKKEDNAL